MVAQGIAGRPEINVMAIGQGVTRAGGQSRYRAGSREGAPRVAVGKRALSHKLGWPESEVDIEPARCASSPLSVTAQQQQPFPREIRW